MYTRLQEVRRSHDEKEFRAIHSRTLIAVEELKKSEANVIGCLQEVDSFLVHRFLGYNSLYRYAIEALRLEEKQAYTYISVARKAKVLPRLQEAIDKKELSISKASRIVSVINDDNQQKWVELASNLSKRNLEREVARVSPRAACPEQTRFLTESLLEMQLPISEDGYKVVERAREVLSSTSGKALSMEQTLIELARFFLEREDPLQKAERAKAREEAKSGRAATPAKASKPAAKTTGFARRPLRAKTLHAVTLRDGGQCRVKMPDGRICGERRWLETHHVRHHAMGGTDEVENLTTICRAHHQNLHAADLRPTPQE